VAGRADCAGEAETRDIEGMVMEPNIRSTFRGLLRSPRVGIGATEDQLNAMQAGLGCRMPDEYLEFLRETDGYSGDVGQAGYVDVLPSSEVLPTNEANHFREWIPGFVLFASNGGGEMYAFDMRGEAPRVVSIPCIPLEPEFAVEVGSSFVDFLKRLAAE
jgi:hypothetical protein